MTSRSGYYVVSDDNELLTSGHVHKWQAIVEFLIGVADDDEVDNLVNGHINIEYVDKEEIKEEE